MKVYGTTELSYQIEQLIKEDSEFVIFVSPYLKLTKRLKAKMSASFDEIKQVAFLYRENELNRTEQEWLQTHSNVELIPIENLHAKIYLNEHRCLVTSMNLYEYSQVNNHEIGIELVEQENPEEFFKVLEEINLMLSSQNSKFNFKRILDSYFDYSVGSFFYNAMTKFDLYGLGKNDEYFINFCNWARDTVDFELDELYQDQTAILKSTNIGKERFEVLKNSISKEAITTYNRR
jgi:hypothetical protein